MGAETFVTPDGQSFLTILDEISKMLQLLAAGQREEEFRASLARQCHDLLAKGSDTASFAHVQNEYLKEIEAQLMERKIPFMSVPVGLVEGVGSTLIVVPSQYEIELKNIEQDVAFLDTKYHSEVDVAALAESAQRMGYKNLTSYDYADANIAFIAHQKLLQAHMPNAMVENADGTYTIYTHPQNQFNPGTAMDGVKFEVAMAMENAKATTCIEATQTRIRQAKYDQQVIADFIADAKQGRNVVLGDSVNTSTKYLEAKNGEIFSWQKKGGDWVSKKLEIDLSADPNVIKLAISSATNDINNMTKMPLKNWEEGCRDVDSKSVTEYLTTAGIKTRPIMTDSKAIAFKTFIDRFYEPFITSVVKTASDLVSAEYNQARITDVLTMQEAAAAEKDKICEILSDENHPLRVELNEKIKNASKDGKSAEKNNEYFDSLVTEMVDTLQGKSKGKDIIDPETKKSLGTMLANRKENPIDKDLLSTHNNKSEKSATYDREETEEKSASYEKSVN